MEDYQGTSVMNYADSEILYTRSHEPRHLHPERSYQNLKTLVFHEKSKFSFSDPYYPINSENNLSMYKKYQELSSKEKDVIIAGRLGSYAYYDLDKTILAALKCFENQIIK